MNLEKQKAIIEAILFAAGRVIKINEFMAILEISSDEVISIINKMQDDYKCENRGIEIIKVEDGYQLATKKEMYEYLYPIFDKRSKPNLSNAVKRTLISLLKDWDGNIKEIENFLKILNNSYTVCDYLRDTGSIFESYTSLTRKRK